VCFLDLDNSFIPIKSSSVLILTAKGMIACSILKIGHTLHSVDADLIFIAMR